MSGLIWSVCWQVAVKNNVDVFYFSCIVPMHVLFTEDGEMDKRVFLATWKDIPVQNEVQYEISNVQHNAGLFNNYSACTCICVLVFAFSRHCYKASGLYVILHLECLG